MIVAATGLLLIVRLKTTHEPASGSMGQPVSGSILGFPKIRGPLLGGPLLRLVAFLDLCGFPPPFPHFPPIPPAPWYPFPPLCGGGCIEMKNCKGITKELYRNYKGTVGEL